MDISYLFYNAPYKQLEWYIKKTQTYSAEVQWGGSSERRK